MRKAAADETRRIAEIRKICDGKYPEIEAKAIDEGWDLTRCELAVLRASRPAGAGRRTSQDHAPRRRSSRPWR